jgi:hypothetical protein
MPITVPEITVNCALDFVGGGPAPVDELVEESGNTSSHEGVTIRSIKKISKMTEK